MYKEVLDMKVLTVSDVVQVLIKHMEILIENYHENKTVMVQEYMTYLGIGGWVGANKSFIERDDLITLYDLLSDYKDLLAVVSEEGFKYLN